MGRYTGRRYTAFPSGNLSNPLYVVYDVEDRCTANEKQIIVKVCKSMQTVKKYVLNSKNTRGYAGWSCDFYDETELKNLLKPGVDLRAIRLQIENCKTDTCFKCVL